MGNKHFMIVLVGSALILSACGSSNDDGAKQSSSGSKQTVAKRTSGKPQITADVVNLKVGMTESAVRKQLAADGWELKNEMKKQQNIPGIDPIIYPERLYLGRMIERDGHYDYETLQVYFAVPLPGKEALATGMMFDRRTLAQETEERLRVNRTMGITADYVTSMLGVVKKKYGEPHRIDEGACTGRSGATQISIPFYEVVYYPNVRNYNNAGGLTVKIGDACRQNLQILIGDGDFARDLQNQFNDYAKTQMEKASSNTKRTVDF